MHDLLVYRRADRRRIALVTLECRHRAAGTNLSLGQRIEIFGRHTRCNRLAELFEHMADELIHVAKPLNSAADRHTIMERRSDATGAIAFMLAASSRATRSGA